MNLHKLQKLLHESLYLNLSTIDSTGQPWGSPLFFVYDNEKREFYWWSPKESRHSKNIKLNEKCFITIFDSNDKEGEGLGIYFKCSVKELTSPREIEGAIELYNKKAKEFKLNLKVCAGSAPTRLYRAKILESWSNVDSYDENENFYDSREDLSLSSVC